MPRTFDAPEPNEETGKRLRKFFTDLLDDTNLRMYHESPESWVRSQQETGVLDDDDSAADPEWEPSGHRGEHQARDRFRARSSGVHRHAAHVSGSLIVVGAGIGFARITLEARAAIAAADEVLYLVPDPVSATGIEALNPSARSLHGLYEEGVSHRAAYERMAEAILEPVRAGKRVCAAFYGHPGVFVLPSHEAISRARAEGFEASMQPGVSAEDCLVADLGVDPGVSGLQSYEAGDFLRRRPAIEPTTALVLWQIGVVGTRTLSASVTAPALGELVGLLLERYPAEHEVVVYEASSYPGVAPLIRRVRLDELGSDAVTLASTLYVPPAPR